jgi:hypothetical protein
VAADQVFVIVAKYTGIALKVSESVKLAARMEANNLLPSVVSWHFIHTSRLLCMPLGIFKMMEIISTRLAAIFSLYTCLRIHLNRIGILETHMFTENNLLPYWFGWLLIKFS